MAAPRQQPQSLLAKRRSRSEEHITLDPAFMAALGSSTPAAGGKAAASSSPAAAAAKAPSSSARASSGGGWQTYRATKPRSDAAVPALRWSRSGVGPWPFAASSASSSSPLLPLSLSASPSPPASPGPATAAAAAAATTTVHPLPRRALSEWHAVGEGATALPLSSANTQKLLEKCGGANEGTMSAAGFGALRVFIPEVGVTKTAPFSPAMTVDSLRLSLMHGFVLAQPVARYRLLLPVCMHGSRPRGLWLDPVRTLGSYGIGLDADQRPFRQFLAPVAALSSSALPRYDSKKKQPAKEEQQQQQQQQQQEMMKPPPMLLLIEDDTRKGVTDIARYRTAFDVKALSATDEAKIGAWMDALGAWDTYVATRTKRLQKMARAGVPACMRGDVWVHMAGVHELLAKNRGVYELLLRRSEELRKDQSYTYTRKIRVDLARSMPNHPFFACEGELGQRALSNVLHAFAIYDTELGYTQGMNFLCATLLCHMSEETAFWMLVQLMRGRYAMRGFYTNGVPLLMSTVATFEELVKRFLPDVAAHLERENVPVLVFSAPWFHTVFSGTEVPHNIVYRIWDMYLLEGQSFVYCVAIALLKLKKEKILKLSCENIVKEMHFKEWDASLGSVLIETAVRVHRLTVRGAEAHDVAAAAAAATTDDSSSPHSQPPPDEK